MKLDKPIICPYCKVEHDASTEIKDADARPSEGSLNICGECGSLAIYDEDLSLREPNISELVELQAEKRLWKEVTIAQDFIRERRTGNIQASGRQRKGSK